MVRIWRASSCAGEPEGVHGNETWPVFTLTHIHLKARVHELQACKAGRRAGMQEGRQAGRRTSVHERTHSPCTRPGIRSSGPSSFPSRKLPICWHRPHTPRGAGRPRGSGAAQRVSLLMRNNAAAHAALSQASSPLTRHKKKKRVRRAPWKIHTPADGGLP